MSEQLLSWLLTYLLHSTLLLGGAWLASRLLPSRSLATREALWRAALIGGVLTAGIQTGLGVEPGLGAWRLASSAPASIEAYAALTPSASVGAEKSRVDTAVLSPSPAAYRSVVARPAGPEVVESPVRSQPITPPRADWKAWVVATWALGALASIAWLAASCLALAGRLADRRPLGAGGLHALLASLQAAARMTGVVLSASARIGSPMAFGWRRPEICLPNRVASEMDQEQQELVLAHELAHHARRDPVWLIAARLIEGLFFFQPLNRLARRRLQEIAEYRCDDWAVERTGRPVTLARCLADVAEWNLRRGSALPVPTLAVERRRLGRRVTRLLDRSYPFPAASRPRWLVAGVALTLALFVLLAPGVSSGHTPPEAPPAPVAPEAPGAPPAPPAPLVNTVPAPAPAPPTVAAPTAPLAAPGPVIAPAPTAPSLPAAPRVAPTPPMPPLLPTPLASPNLPAPLAPVPAPSASPAPAPPVPGVAPRLAPVPAPPALPHADPANGEWVLHDAPWPVSATVPLAELAEVSDLVAVSANEALELSRSLSGVLAAEEWAVIADSVAAAVEIQPSPEEMAWLVAFSRELEELSESSAAGSARIAELSLEMARAFRPDAEALARIESLSGELAESARLDPKAAARIAALSQELRAEIEATRPDREELRRRHEQIRRDIEARRPDLEELRRELDRMSERQEARRLERDADRATRELELRELRAEVETLREELRRREKGDG